jgi:hypothetical protein
MRLVGSDDVRQTICIKKVVNGSGAEAHSAAASRGFAKTTGGKVGLQLLRGGIGPDAITGNLFHPIFLVVVRGHHSSDVGERENGLNFRVVLLDGARDAAVDAENVVIDDCGERKAVKSLVALFPHSLSHGRAKSVFALENETLLVVMLLPAVDVPRLVVAAQEVNLPGVEQLESKEVCDTLEGAHAAVHVVTQEEELARRQIHAELPDVVGEEVQVL